MRQSGFTLLEILLVIVLIGSAATLVVMSFPIVKKNTLEQQLLLFREQLDFALVYSQQNERLLGIQMRPDGWEFKILQYSRGGNNNSTQLSGIWKGYSWQNWHLHNTSLNNKLPDDVQLELQYPSLQEWPKANSVSVEPDILLLPGGEVTPFTLILRELSSGLSIYIRIDNLGGIYLSDDGITQ
ncbi:type II secretion system minor pseudopilin GspH [Yersinia enterocolitica]|uniref:type II secretion system minor pseudopilin GspH n=1 Tax=Yersinia enterocolitica TaxID=630 RepID=UPI003AB8183E